MKSGHIFPVYGNKCQGERNVEVGKSWAVTIQRAAQASSYSPPDGWELASVGAARWPIIGGSFENLSIRSFSIL